jgi:Mrp family chromosome partitioning ATPase
VPKTLGEVSHGSGPGLHWLRWLEELRNEFEFVVIQGPAAGASSEAALLGQLTDGIILVLDARSTRRAAARMAKETLDAAQCRILGTVLTQRMFPIPERIYRRL